MSLEMIIDSLLPRDFWSSKAYLKSLGSDAQQTPQIDIGTEFSYLWLLFRYIFFSSFIKIRKVSKLNCFIMLDHYQSEKIQLQN